MVIDPSALLAILLKEPEAEALARAIWRGTPRLLSAAGLLEASMVIEARLGVEGSRDLDLLIYRAGIEIVPVDVQQADVARVAWRRYGKGNHPAALNFGDCFSYALAKVTGGTLLFKGGDFGRTDLEAMIG